MRPLTLLFCILATVLNVCRCATIRGKTNSLQVDDAVFLGLKRDRTTSHSPIKFDHVGLDVLGSYDKREGKFYTDNPGYFWIAMSAGARKGRHVHYYLYKGDNIMCSIYRDVTSHQGNETASRDGILHLGRMDSIYVENWDTLFSDKGLESSLSVFRLSGLMMKNVYFSAVRPYFRIVSARKSLNLPTITVNEGNAFDGSHFTAPEDGLYFLSYSFALCSGHCKGDVTLRRRFAILATLVRNSTHANDLDMISRSGLYQLNKNDRVHIQSETTCQIIGHTKTTNQTTFSGFLYNPKHGEKRAWSVAKTTSWRGSKASMSPITFDEVLINLNNDWDAKRHLYVTPVSGVYYVTVAVGALPNVPVDVGIMVDNVEKASVVNSSPNKNGIDIVSRSVIMHLEKGSFVYLKAEKYTGIYSSIEQHTVFTGFLLFPRP